MVRNMPNVLTRRGCEMCVAWRVSFGKPARASSAPNHPLAARLEVLSTIGVGLSTKISDTQSIKRNAEVHEQGKLLRWLYRRQAPLMAPWLLSNTMTPLRQQRWCDHVISDLPLASGSQASKSHARQAKETDNRSRHYKPARDDQDIA